MAALNPQKQGDHIGPHIQSNIINALTHNGQPRQTGFYGGTIHIDLWYWLINHVSRHEIDKEPNLFLSICVSRKILKNMK